MSRAQSPSRDQTITLNFLADKVVRITDAIQELKFEMEDLRADKIANQIPRNRQEAFTETIHQEGEDIKTYDKALLLIPEFDGHNAESFIGHVQMAVRRLAANQHDLLLCSIIAQKLTGRAKGTIRIDVTPNFPQLYEKLRFLYGKAQNLSALEVQRDTCIQRHNESIDEFINRFLRIHDEIITTLNSQGIGVTTICIQEEIYQQKAIEVFRRNVKPEIGDHLYSFELDTLNRTFSKARAFEGELQLRKLRVQRSENFKKPSPRFQPKECTYCKRRGHEEKECRTKAFHQQRGQNFHERPSTHRPPDRSPASHRSQAIVQNPEQHFDRSFSKDQEELTSEHLELA